MTLPACPPARIVLHETPKEKRRTASWNIPNPRRAHPLGQPPFPAPAPAPGPRSPSRDLSSAAPAAGMGVAGLPDGAVCSISVQIRAIIGFAVTAVAAVAMAVGIVTVSSASLPSACCISFGGFRSGARLPGLFSASVPLPCRARGIGLTYSWLGPPNSLCRGRSLLGFCHVGCSRLPGSVPLLLNRCFAG